MAPQANESKPMYQKDEKALCFHGELLYDAKVLEVRRQDAKDKTSPHEYRVHYKGWKNTWDDWVPQDRLRKLTDDNRELAANLRRELIAQTAPKPASKPTGKTRRGQGSEIGSGRGSEERTSSVPAGGPRGSKRARDNDIEKVGGPHSDYERSHTSRPPFAGSSPVRLTSAGALFAGDALSPENVKALERVSGPYRFPAPWIHITGLNNNDNDDSSAVCTQGQGGPSRIKLVVNKGSMAKNKQEESTLDPSLGLSQFIHVPRQAAVKASQALSVASSTKAKADAAGISRFDVRVETGQRNRTTASGTIEINNRKEREEAISGLGKSQRSDYLKCSEEGLGSEDEASSSMEKRNMDASSAIANKQKRVQFSSSLLSTTSPSSITGLPQNTIWSNTFTGFQTTQDNKMSKRRRMNPPLKTSLPTETPSNDHGNGRDEAYWTPERQGQIRNESVDEILARPPPPDVPERFSNTTLRERPKQYWAPLISGTTMQEKAVIEDELVEAGELTIKPTAHPGYIKVMNEDPGNFNKKLFYQGVGPDRRLAIAGVPKDPLVIDPPGSGGPFDALKHPQRLVEQLNRDDAETLFGWNEKALLKIPRKLMAELFPHILAKMPYNVLAKQHHSVLEKLPDDHPFFEWLDQHSAEEAARQSTAPRHTRNTRNNARISASNVEPTTTARILSLPSQNLLVPEIKAPPASSTRDSLQPQAKCTTCADLGVKCNLEKPICFFCRHQGLPCSFNINALPEGDDFLYSGITDAARKLKLDKPRDTSHLHLGPNTRVPPELHPKATYGTVSNVEKKGLRKRVSKQLTQAPLFDHAGNFVTPAEDRLAYTSLYPQEENYYSRPSIRISIPDHLKNLLVDDWENVTKSMLLVPLPSLAPANYILDEYFNEEKMNRRLGSVEADILEEFVAGLKTYFEKSVGKILLYRFERNQLAEVRKLWESGRFKEWDGKGPGDCYGAEHLTRMIVNLPEIIAQTNMDAESVARLKSELSKFSTWLSRNSGRFFCAKYEKPSAEYIENAR